MILDVRGFGFGVRDFLVWGSGFLGFRFVVSGLAFCSFWFSRCRGLGGSGFRGSGFRVLGFEVPGFGIGVSRFGLLEVRGFGFVVSGSGFRG